LKYFDEHTVGLFICCRDDRAEIKLSAREQLYARAFHLRACRKFDDAQKLQSLVDSLHNGSLWFAMLG